MISHSSALYWRSPLELILLARFLPFQVWYYGVVLLKAPMFSHSSSDLVTSFRQQTVWDWYLSWRLVPEFPLSTQLPLISVLAFSYSTMWVLWTTPTMLSTWVIEGHMKESILAHGTRDKGDKEEGKNLSRIALRQIELLWGKLLWFNFRPIHLRILTLTDPYQVRF